MWHTSASLPRKWAKALIFCDELIYVYAFALEAAEQQHITVSKSTGMGHPLWLTSILHYLFKFDQMTSLSLSFLICTRDNDTSNAYCLRSALLGIRL